MSVHPTNEDLAIAKTLFNSNSNLSLNLNYEETATQLMKVYMANGISEESAFATAYAIVYSVENPFK